MRRVRVELGARGYDVTVGPGALGMAGDVLGGRARAAIVSQRGVAERWCERVERALDGASVATELFLVGDAEGAKSLTTVEDLCRRFARWELGRGDVVVALGGGVVGDTAGFAAAVYHRGVAYLQAPTTLLAQVDAAIGGKTAVNLHEGKNLVGAFHQPVAVLADLDTLATLPEREYRSGLGEVLKYACALDDELGDLLCTKADAVLARDPGVLEDIVVRSARIKAEVVAADEEERTGLRARLNYGHTLAHALETLGGYALAHGEAVAIGVVFAAHLARALGRIGPERVERHHAMVEGLGLPASVQGRIGRAAAFAQMRRDKKTRDPSALTFVLLGPDGLELVDVADERALHEAADAVGLGD